MTLPIERVFLGARPGYHILAIKLSRELIMSEKNEVCERLVMHLYNHDVSLSREFSEYEMHFRPSPRSAPLFASLPEAIEEYQLLLTSLGVEGHEIIVDGDLLPFDERESTEELAAAGLRY